MERIAKDKRIQIRGVRIFIEGLEDIVRLIVAAGREFSVTTDRYKFEDFSEFCREFEGGLDSNNVIFNIGNHDLTVNFGEGRATIYTYRHDVQTAGLFQQIEEEIIRWRPITFFIEDGRVLFIIWILVNIFNQLGVKFFAEETALYIGIALNSVVMVWAMYIWLRFFPKFSRVAVPRRKSKEKGFLLRNRDSLILVIVGALAGSLFTVIGSLLYDNYKKELIRENSPETELGQKFNTEREFRK